MGFWFLGYFSSYIEWSWDGFIAAFLLLNPFGFAFYNICTKLVLQESFDIPDVLFSTCHHYADHCDSSAIPPKALSKHEAFRLRHVHPSQLPRLILYRVFLSLVISSKNSTPLLLFLCTLSFNLADSRSFRLQLHTVPPFDLILQHSIDESMLFDDGQALEFRAHNIQSVHTATTATDILDLYNIQSVTWNQKEEDGNKK